MTKDEQVFLHHMNDIASRSYYEGRPCFSDFMSMYEQDLLLRHQDDILKDTGAEGLFFSGGYPHAERVLAAFGAFEPEGWPALWLHITPAYPKFSAVPGHRDYLGSILGLGLKREKIGDILVQDDGAWIYVRRETSDFILEELKQVGRTIVRIQAEDLPEAYRMPRFSVSRKTVSSVRLDTIIAAAYGLSRSKAVQCITDGEVFINGRMITGNSHAVKSGDVISVRHKGKFVFVDLQNKSKKNKCIIEIRKYV